MTIKVSSHRPTLQELESRDVPATFYVDPAATAVSTTFNVGAPNETGGLTFGTTLFSTLSAALTKAAANAEADTIFLARSTTPIDVDNSGGAVTIADNITLVGSGQGATILAPTDNTADEFTSVFLVPLGKSLHVRDLTFDAQGKNVGIGFAFDEGSGSFNQTTVANVKFPGPFGTAIAAANSATVSVMNSTISNYGRQGVSFFDALAGSGVWSSTIVGPGYSAASVSYGVSVEGITPAGTGVIISGNKISNNTAKSGGFESAGVFIAEFLAGDGTFATVIGNDIDGNTVGVLIGASATDKATALVNYNNLNSNFIGVRVDGSETSDARNNWWGDVTGPFNPTLNPPGKGTEVSLKTIISPFLSKATPVLAVNTLAEYVEKLTTLGVQIDLDPSQSLPVRAGADIKILIEFSDSVSGFTTADLDVTLVDGATGTPTLALTGSGNSYTLVVSGVKGPGRVLVQVKENSVMNVSGFLNQRSNIEEAALATPFRRDAVSVSNGTPGISPPAFLLNNAIGVTRSVVPFSGAFTGEVRSAAGDVNGDGVADLVVGAGPSGSSHVQIFDGMTGSIIHQFFAYDPAFTGGVHVATGDVNGDGYGDVIVGAGAGGSAHVRVFSGFDYSTLGDFFAFEADFRGGSRVASGDFNGDGKFDVIVSRDSGNAAVEIYDGSKIGTATKLVADLTSFTDAGFSFGVNVASADLTGDGISDLIVGAGAGGAPRVRVFDGASIFAGTPSVIADFLTGPAGSTTGVSVAATDKIGGAGDLLATNDLNPAVAPQSLVKVYRSATVLGGTAGESTFDATFDLFPTFANGNFLGG